jgi:transposase, IS6 family
MTLARPFRGFRFPPEVILWAVRWYLRFAVSLRDLEEMLAERGVRVDHVSPHRRVQRFAPELERRLRPRLRATGRTWHVGETYIRVGGAWRYLYRAVDGAGQTAEFLLSAARDAAAARRFVARALGRGRARAPRLVVTDGLASYRTALGELKRGGLLSEATRHRRGRWLDNRVERDHRRIKRRTRPMLGLKRFDAARRALAGIEAMAMLAKGQVRAVPSCHAPAQRAFVHRLFGLAA